EAPPRPRARLYLPARRPALSPRPFPQPDQLVRGQSRFLLRGISELRQRRQESGVPAGTLEHLRVHLRLAGAGDGHGQHPRPRPAQEVPRQAARALPHSHAVGGAYFARDPRLALDLRLHLQRDQLLLKVVGWLGPGQWYYWLGDPTLGMV